MKHFNLIDILTVILLAIVIPICVVKIGDKLFPVNIEKPITILNTEVKTKLLTIENKYKKYDIKFYITTDENIKITWTHKNNTYGSQLDSKFQTDDRYLELVIEKITQKVDKQ